VSRTLTEVLGNTQKLDGGAMFGNAPRALWSRWMPADDLNRIEFACRAMLIRDDDRITLCETGVGAFFPPDLRERYGVGPDHALLDNLAAVGLSHEDIDVVVLSHLHFDHAGGLLAAWTPEAPDPPLLFPNATFVIGRRAWERASHPHPRDRASFIPGLVEKLAATGRVELVDGERSETLGSGWRFHTSDGHTPGLLLAEVDMPGGPVVFAADLIPGRPWIHVPITMGYDRFPEQLIDEKERLLTDLLARGGRLFFTHDPDVALAKVARDPKGRFVPADEVAHPVALAA
jgi:glyoxylase-like metal-dependent hydrolase (beta-lactamase superfamily II)